MTELPKPYYEEPGITIYCADCRDILPLLEPVDLVLTDPPYGIKRFEKAFGHSRFNGCNTAIDGVPWDKKPEKDLLLSIINKAQNAIIWGLSNLDLPPTEYFFVWDKQQTVSNFASAELAYTNLKMPSKVFRYGIHKHNHEKDSQGHPTIKPLKLMEWCLCFAPLACTILDPFMGSGTTLVAAKNLGRKAIGIELEEKYCAIAVERLRQGVLPFGGL